MTTTTIPRVACSPGAVGISGSSSSGRYYSQWMTPDQARALAADLLEKARRADASGG